MSDASERGGAQHTPGPWIAAGSYILAQRNPGGTKHHIAEASRDQPSQVCLANARLIAAAPAMREALELCLHALTDETGNVEAREYDASVAARAALAKARGGAQ